MTGQSLTKLGYNNCLKQLARITLMPIYLESCGAIRTSSNDRKRENQICVLHTQALRVILSHLSTSPSRKVSKGKLHVWWHSLLSLAVSCLIFIEANLERAWQDGVTRVDVNNTQEILSLRELKPKFGTRPSDARCALLGNVQLLLGSHR